MIDLANAADVAQPRIEVSGRPTDEELQLINQHANAPQTKDSVFVFQMEISNDLLDSFGTRMDPDTTLKNYADDFREGLSIQNSHNTDELPLARSFWADLERRGSAGDPRDPERTAVVAKVYIPRGINVTGVATDDLIRAIEAGVVRDASVHFDDSATYQCSICGGDMYERESSCVHVLGATYNGKRAQALIVDAHAVEGSLVYDASTPMAMIQKAERMAAAGKLDARQVDRLERLYRTRIRPRRASHHEETQMTTSLRLSEREHILLAQLRAKARAADALTSLDPDTASAVQEQLDQLAATHEEHGNTLQLLGGVIGKGMGLAGRRRGPFAPNPTIPSGADTPDVSKIHPVLDKVHEDLVSQHDAYGEAIKSLRSLFGMGAEFGPEYGLPKKPASINDMNPNAPLSDFHGDLSVFGADPAYPAVPSVPDNVLTAAHPDRARRYDWLDAFRTDPVPGHRVGEL